jgi:hypothetical protein
MGDTNGELGRALPLGRTAEVAEAGLFKPDHRKRPPPEASLGPPR